jgi:hypothetical protein
MAAATATATLLGPPIVHKAKVAVVETRPKLKPKPSISSESDDSESSYSDYGDGVPMQVRKEEGPRTGRAIA